MATTDFKTWIYENVDINDINEVWSLYQAVIGESNDYHPYSATRKSGILLVQHSNQSDPLVIASEEAKSAFINILEYPYLEQGGIELAKAFEDHMSHD
ncbi:hypothetical protein [Sphingobacterium sp. HMA12]|uniref:hypothetical protein n=1 Tax=Sphingobacterium sp. HMA12 TaxID=2050894 RepID=UPI000CEA6EC1|nr:hypothetical protein [Sphingobacterium sp. HMA12]